MSRCHQTDALLDAIFAGADLTGGQADHAAGCSECARALAHARRFDGELHRIGIDLSPESVPSAVLAAPSRIRGGRSMTWRPRLAGVAAAIVLLAVLIGGAQLLASVGEQRVGIDGEREAVSVESVVAWARGVLDPTLRAQGVQSPAAVWDLVRVERCGSTGIAFFEGRNADDERTYLWGTGPINGGPQAATGQHRSVDDVTVAKRRAGLPPCDIVVDRVTQTVLDEVGGARELWALATSEEFFDGETRVIGATPLAEGHRRGANGEELIPTYLMLLERRTERAYWIERPSISVVDGWAVSTNAEADVERLGNPPRMRVFAEPGQLDETLFGWIDDPRVRAVDIWIPRQATILRYSVAAPGFLIQFEARVGPVDEMEYELIDAAGTVLAGGSVEPWPPTQRAP